jgi:hypothetical protein
MGWNSMEDLMLEDSGTVELKTRTKAKYLA